MPTLVGSKGQVVIEREIRNRLGVQPGAVAVQTLVGDRVEIRFVPPAHSESLFGVLSSHLSRGAATRAWSEVKRRAWGAAAKDKERTPSRRSRTRRSP
ncbi:MAG: AbrB/MazE/SpoVT family DNA-binding domain-containing protein [bacterium]|nr:AbrB/MazE/SpoVT family DNA-binding domain-containing protein [bacterium]